MSSFATKMVVVFGSMFGILAAALFMYCLLLIFCPTTLIQSSPEKQTVSDKLDSDKLVELQKQEIQDQGD